MVDALLEESIKPDHKRVHVFGSHICDGNAAYRLISQLLACQGVLHANVDMHDCDKVVRVVSAGLDDTLLKRKIWELGVEVYELPD